MAKQKEFGSCLMIGLGILTNLWMEYEIGKAVAKSEGLLEIIPQTIIFLAINGACLVAHIEPNDKQ